MSKAHIFPRWLGDFIDERTDKHAVTVGVVETFEPGMPTPSVARIVRPGDAGTAKVRRVCAKCNSGWLGALETPAKEIVPSLVRGDNVRISSEHQRVLASWLSAIAFLIDADSADNLFISQDDRDHFRRSGTPPLNNWHIWLARYSGQNWHAHRVRRMGLTLRPVGDEPGVREEGNTQVATIVLGQLCAHIYSSSVMDFAGYEGIELRKVWPPSPFGFRWHTVPHIDDNQVVRLAEALAGTLPVMA